MPFPSYPVFYSSFDCRVSHVEYDDVLVAVFAQQYHNVDQVAEFQNDLNSFYQNGGIHLEKVRLESGLVCAALSSDGRYYRARILTRVNSHELPNSIDVRFIDYGNVEKVHSENLKELEDIHRLQHALANKFYLPVRQHRCSEEVLNEILKVTKFNGYPLRIDITDNYEHYWIADVFISSSIKSLCEYLQSQHLISYRDPHNIHDVLEKIYWNM